MTPAALLVLRTLGKPDHDAPPFYRFRDMPPSWVKLARAVCLFCGKGKGRVEGLWRYNAKNAVCGPCRQSLRAGKMPPLNPASPVVRMLR